MQHQYCFLSVDKLLKDVRSNEQLFGSLPVVMGGLLKFSLLYDVELEHQRLRLLFRNQIFGLSFASFF